MINGTKASPDAEDADRVLNDYDRTRTAEQLVIIGHALAGNEVDALDVLLDAAVIHYTDFFYEGDYETDLGFIVSEIARRFSDQAEFHDEAGLYLGRFVEDDGFGAEPPCSDSMTVRDGPGTICPCCGRIWDGPHPRFGPDPGSVGSGGCP